MVSGASTMTFLAFPREIRDLIYVHLNTNDTIYSLTATKVATIGGPPSFDLNTINTCKSIRREMIEILCSHNTFRFMFSDTSTQSSHDEFASVTTRVELDIDLFIYLLVEF